MARSDRNTGELLTSAAHQPPPRDARADREDIRGALDRTCAAGARERNAGSRALLLDQLGQADSPPSASIRTFSSPLRSGPSRPPALPAGVFLSIGCAGFA